MAVEGDRLVDVAAGTQDFTEIGEGVWVARVVSGVPAPLEDHDAVRVLAPGEWLSVAWLPADVPIVRALLAESPGGAGT